MVQLVIPNCIQVRVRWSLQGVVPAYNVLTAQSGSGTQPTQAIANTVGAAIKAAYTSSGLAAVQATTLGISSIGLRWIGAPNFAEFIDSGGSVVGTGAGDPLPRQIALCVTLRTAMAGKSYRGRVYIPGFTEAQNDSGGAAVAGAVTAAVAFVTAIQTSLASSGYTLGVGSRERVAVPTHVPPITAKAAFFTPLTAILSRDNTWETQRRRRV